MNNDSLRLYLVSEVQDEGPLSLEETLAKHREVCEAHERKCPIEAKLEKKIDEKKSGDDKSDKIGGVSSSQSGNTNYAGPTCREIGLSADKGYADAIQDLKRWYQKTQGGIDERAKERYRDPSSIKGIWFDPNYTPVLIMAGISHSYYDSIEDLVKTVTGKGFEESRFSDDTSDPKEYAFSLKLNPYHTGHGQLTFYNQQLNKSITANIEYDQKIRDDWEAERQRAEETYRRAYGEVGNMFFPKPESPKSESASQSSNAGYDKTYSPRSYSDLRSGRGGWSKGEYNPYRY